MVPAESLFTKDVANVTFDDVRRFCDLRIREGLRIEYKVDFPEELEKAVASFANTAGGIILIGVETDEANRPSQIVGIDLDEGIEERVLNICHSNSYPPITPEVVLCPFSSKGDADHDKRVAFVRVRESEQVPHFIGKRRNLIYVRVDNVSEQASADDIRTLMNKREKGAQLSKELVESRRPVTPKYSAADPRLFTVQVIVVPSYITRDLIEFTHEADEFIRKTPRYLIFGDMKPKQRGIEFVGRNEDVVGPKSRYFSEVTSEGLVLYREDNRMVYEIHCPRVVLVLDRVLEYGLGIFKRWGYFGGLDIRLDLDSVKGCRLSTGTPFMLGSYVSDKEYVCVERHTAVDDLVSDRMEVVTSIFMEFARAFKWSLDRKDARNAVESWLSKL